MDAATLYDRVEARLPAEGFDISAEQLTREVLHSLAERLSPDDAAELGAELPVELGDLLAAASGESRLVRDEFIEDVAARLDLDDDDAELGVTAVLIGLREYLEPMVAIDQIIATLPPDLARLMNA